MIVWVDVETTGLKEEKDHLLEVALVATDDNLTERGAASCVVKPVGIGIADVDMPLKVREMHEKSGLLADVAKEDALRLYEGEESLIAWLERTFGRIEDLRGIPLAGSTVSFDRRWLKKHMPKLEELFSYRSIDVSCLTELSNRWAPAVYNNRPKQDAGVPHRALADVRQSIESLRYYREHFLKVQS